MVPVVRPFAAVFGYEHCDFFYTIRCPVFGSNILTPDTIPYNKYSGMSELAQKQVTPDTSKVRYKTNLYILFQIFYDLK